MSIAALHAFALSAARRCAATIALACVGAVVATPAMAQVTYTYTGQAFTNFSCGPSPSGSGTAGCSVPAPTNPYTDYLATDHVSVSLTLSSPLPANMAITDVRGFAGFQLTMNDGRHTVTNADAVGMFAELSTDSAGNVANWRLVINTGGVDNGGISTMNSAFVADMGTLRCCDPTVSGDFGQNFNLPGTWAGGTASPLVAVRNLKTLVASPSLMLSAGQINSLTDKLDNVLASLQAGLTKQAVNQLNSFVNSVQSWQKNGKISTAAAATLVAGAQAIIAVLS